MIVSAALYSPFCLATFVQVRAHAVQSHLCPSHMRGSRDRRCSCVGVEDPSRSFGGHLYFSPCCRCPLVVASAGACCGLVITMTSPITLSTEFPCWRSSGTFDHDIMQRMDSRAVGVCCCACACICACAPMLCVYLVGAGAGARLWECGVIPRSGFVVYVLGWAQVLDAKWMPKLNRAALIGTVVFAFLIFATSVWAELLSGTVW